VRNSKTISLSIIKTTRSKKIQQVGDSPLEQKNCLYIDAAIFHGKKRFSKELNTELDMYNDTESRTAKVK
jgi:hypothetical protein